MKKIRIGGLETVLQIKNDQEGGFAEMSYAGSFLFDSSSDPSPRFKF